MTISQAFEPFWTLADYRRFLNHPEPLIRMWATDRIEEQYPQAMAESFVGLLADPDPYLQINAARAIGDSGDARYEADLLAALPRSRGYVRNWLTTALGRLRSPMILPQLVNDLADPPTRSLRDETRMLNLRSTIEALGYYPDEAARAALWRFVERYRGNDRLSYAACTGLLRLADPTAVSRLVEWYRHQRVRSRQGWEHTLLALAQAAGVGRLTQAFIETMPDGPEGTLWLVSTWFEQGVDYSDAFEAAVYQAASLKYADLLPAILAELERVAAQRGDDLPAWLVNWQTSDRPGGYRWRMVYAYHVVATLVKTPPSRKTAYQEAVALSLALLSQALIDQDDETSLRSASNELIRQATLLSILESPRQNVWPELIEQVIALGPGVVPHLIEVLKGKPYWAMLRALEALAQLARNYPESVEDAIPTLLGLIDADQGDGILEAVTAVLQAIGPAVIIPAAVRLGLVDYVYDLYITSILANIPTTASAQALMSYIAVKQSLDEFEVDALADLGHPAALPYLRDSFEWAEDPILCTALYRLALLSNYTGPELAAWRAVALEAYQEFADDQPDEPSASSYQNGR